MAGYIVIGVGFLLVAIGVIAQIRYKDFNRKLLAASIIDSAGLIIIFIGIMIRTGFTVFTLKIFVVLVIMLMINPISTHKIARSHHLSHNKENKDDI